MNFKEISNKYPNINLKYIKYFNNITNYNSINALKYVVLYTSGHNIDWPDTIDSETGIFKYHGDNRTPGKDLHDTKKQGNIILKNIKSILHHFFI